MKRLRVLFVGNTAGAMTPVADWLCANGHEAIILEMYHNDRYELTSRFPFARMSTSATDFVVSIKDAILDLNPTHIHVNAYYSSLPIIRACSPFTPVIMHYHGIEIRFRKRIHPTVRLFADKVIVSTPDLRKYGDWYGCPVPKEFYFRGGRQLGTAVMFFGQVLPLADTDEKTQDAEKICKELGLELTIINNQRGESVPSHKMPEFLSSFEYLFDFKGLVHSPIFSKTALEAISCGVKVIHDSDLTKIYTSYPIKTPKDYYELYLSVENPPAYKIPFQMLASLILTSYFARMLGRKIRSVMKRTS
ncbi:MAG: glycosyltransferase [Candidatus Thorarchaeota archaeon]